jgi:uncharacterized protein
LIAYIDTSVIVPLYVPEALSETIEAYLNEDRVLALSGLTELEFYSAISKKIRTSEINNPDAVNILKYFNNHLSENYFKRLSISNEHFQLAKNLIGEFSTSLRTLDAVHLVLSDNHCDLFVTADKVLADAAHHFGIKTEFIH